jgi:predicted nucleotidyltransferase component of viral defense system
MDSGNIYYKQVQLLVQLLPLIAEENCFALKGGTAINLFIRELPRLSVDIDLVYLPMQDRKEALAGITSALARIKQRILQALPKANVIEAYKNKPDAMRLVVSHNNVQIKVELSPVLRGTVFESELLTVCTKVENEFGYAEIAVVSLADLYAGKICAALDRQHPRDLFDVMWLLKTEGFTDDIRKALIVYIISHPSPIVELLDIRYKDLEQIYQGEFLNMTEAPVSLEELEATRDQLIELIRTTLLDSEKQFLLSFKKMKPQWDLLGLHNIENLPAVKWKMINLQKMSKDKHKTAYRKLERCLLTGSNN